MPISPSDYMNISMGATAGGGLLNSIAGLIAQQNMADALKGQLAQQGQYRQQAMGQFGQGLQQQGAQAFTGAQQQGAGQRLAQYGALDNVPLAMAQPQGQRPGQALASQQITNRAAANLGGYQDATHSQGVSQLQNQRLIDMISNFAGGTARTFPYQMYQAQQSGAPLNMIGTGLAGLGQGYGMWGLFNALNKKPYVDPSTDTGSNSEETFTNR